MKARLRPRVAIEVSALFSVLLVVVFLFMTSPQWGYRYYRIAVDLPKAQHADMEDYDRSDAITIYVTRKGDIYCRTDRVKPEWLPQKIEEAVKNGAQRKVYIEADRRAQYGSVAAVLDQVRSAGITDVTFISRGYYFALEPNPRVPAVRQSTPTRK